MKQIDGDLLEIEEGILLHQVNCRGVTGGLAGALHRQYPLAFRRYSAMCLEAQDDGSTHTLLGCFCVSRATHHPPHIWVCHIFGQIGPGPNTDLEAVDSAVRDFTSDWLATHPQQVYAPYQMGCGLGGGNWDEYLPILVKHVPNITIVRKF